MFKFVATVLLSLSLLVNSQDLGSLIGVATGDGGGDLGIFNSLISSVIGQWGNMSSDDYTQLFNNFQQQGLNSVWHGINDHCGSNFECGPNACCVQPKINGKRAITDGSIIHFASYCAPLRSLSQTCSNHVSGAHYYTFQCPCVNGLRCVPGKIIQLHPLLTIQADSTCQV